MLFPSVFYFFRVCNSYTCLIFNGSHSPFLLLCDLPNTLIDSSTFVLYVGFLHTSAYLIKVCFFINLPTSFDLSTQEIVVSGVFSGFTFFSLQCTSFIS